MSRPKIVAWAIYGILLALALFFALTAPAGATTSTTSFAASAGWTQIAQISATAAAPQNFASIPQTYNDLLVVYGQDTFSTSTTLDLKISADNGSTLSSSLSSGGASSVNMTGSYLFINYKADTGLYLTCTTLSMTSPHGQICGGSSGQWVATGGINYIRANTTGNLTVGTITLYGR